MRFSGARLRARRTPKIFTDEEKALTLAFDPQTTKLQMSSIGPEVESGEKRKPERVWVQVPFKLRVENLKRTAMTTTTKKKKKKKGGK